MIRKIYLNPKFIIFSLLIFALASFGLFFFQERGSTLIVDLILYTLGVLSINLLISLFFTLETILLKFRGDKVVVFFFT